MSTRSMKDGEQLMTQREVIALINRGLHRHVERDHPIRYEWRLLKNDLRDARIAIAKYFKDIWDSLAKRDGRDPL